MLSLNSHAIVPIPAHLHQFVSDDIAFRYRHRELSPTVEQRLYRNQLALNLALDFLVSQAQLETQRWLECDGSALELVEGQQRLVVLPLGSAGSTLIIPELWMVHRTLKADAFLLIQINTNEHWVRYLGSAKPHQIQCHQTDAGSTFSLELDQLIVADQSLLSLLHEQA